MREVYTEVYTGTGAALPIEIGFQPSYCEILTKTGGLVAMWHDSEPNYTRIVHPYVDRLLDDAVLQIGTTPTAVANLAFNFVIAGIPYTKGATAAGTAPGNDVIPPRPVGRGCVRHRFRREHRRHRGRRERNRLRNCRSCAGRMCCRRSLPCSHRLCGREKIRWRFHLRKHVARRCQLDR